MAQDLLQIARETGRVPLSWAGGTRQQDYLNLGDALSAVMVSLYSGKPIERVPFRSNRPRLAAVGTIGQNVYGGRVWYWGTGCSNYAMSGGARSRFSATDDTDRIITSTRGPISSALLGGGRLATQVFGDPVWLLPRFYQPEPVKTHELGVIIHLSDLADRDVECHPKPEIARYRIPADMAGAVKLINTVTPISTAGMKARMDNILSCKRIVSTSLHGLVFAESYGVPCLYFPPFGKTGLADLPIEADGPIDLRMSDLYAGAGRDRIWAYRQPRAQMTDWAAVIDAIDQVWEQAQIDEQALINAFPLDLNPLSARPGETIWDHPVLNSFEYAHDVAALQRAARTEQDAAAAQSSVVQVHWRPRLKKLNLPATVNGAAAPARPLSLGNHDGGAYLPLAWAAGQVGGGALNLGDALSPVIAAAISGLPVRHVNFDSPAERLVSVGTIAHGQKNGVAHLWGPGLDAARNPVSGDAPYAPPPETDLIVHAMRGPFSAGALRAGGVHAPEIFGDPVYLTPRILPMKNVEKKYDLGVILHLTEFEQSEHFARNGETDLRPLFRRYHIPAAFRRRVRLITMNCAPTFTAIRAKLTEIASCRAILSSSLHGLVLADAYGVPNAWFSTLGDGLYKANTMNKSDRMDHRMRDLYAGQGRAEIEFYGSDRTKDSDWDRIIGAMTNEVDTRQVDSRALFNAFPGPRAVSYDDRRWPVPRGLVSNFS